MIRQVSVDRLRAGMFLHRLEGAWVAHPFWRNTFLLEEEDLSKLRQTGLAHVWIDTERGLDVPDENDERDEAEALPQPDVDYVEMPALPDPTQPMALATPDVQEMALDEASRLCTNATEALGKVYADVRLGRALDTAQCKAIVSEVVEHVMGHGGALIMVARLKHHDDYSHVHSVAVCALMVALGRQLGFTRDRMAEVGLAGLVHDVGKLLVPTELLNKRGPLTPEEFQLVKTHTQRGHKLLRDSGTVSETVLDVCQHHHERIDGKGYPHSLRPPTISAPARMAAICDVYEALTAHRPHRPRIEPGIALREMASQSGSFDRQLMQVFVRTVGIYPLGSLVRLHTQDLAVVQSQDPNDLLKPQVRVVYSLATRRPIEPRTLTLSGGHNGIVCLETPESLGSDTLRLVSQVLPSWRPL